MSAFCNINLYVKNGEDWSKPIQGTGGSSYISKEKNGPYTSDECFKMALTDAISVACKALGFAADVYWDADTTKYNQTNIATPKNQANPSDEVRCPQCGGKINSIQTKDGNILNPKQVLEGYGMCGICYKKRAANG